MNATRDALPSDPTLWDATTQAAAIREGRLGSEQLLDLQLERLARADSEPWRVNAVCTTDLERARAACREADEAVRHGDPLGPLHGLPITIKDAIATEGIVSTGGATVLRDHVPKADAPAVAALRRAGAIVWGKTNLPEWSGEWQSFNELFGTTNNPWDPARTPGGSSGGAAAAVACGISSFELGTDIGGSVRVPASMCGVFGHKPSFGVIPTLGYLDEPRGGDTQSDVNTFGPIARSARDLAMLLDVLVMPTPDLAPAVRIELPRADDVRSLEGLRVAAWIDEPTMPIESAMRSVLHRAVDAIEAAGAVVDRAARPAIDPATWIDGARLIGAAVSVSDDDERPLTHQRWLRMHRERERRRAEWARFFESFDVVVCPVTTVVAFEHAQEGGWDTRSVPFDGGTIRYLELEAWPATVGAAYLPSTSVPVGFTAAGLPVGMQVVSPFLHDHRSIAVAGLVADACLAGYHPPPCTFR